MRGTEWPGRASAIAAALCLPLVLLGVGASGPRFKAIVIQPLMNPVPAPTQGPLPDPDRDGGPLVAQLVLSLTSGVDVRWRPVDPGGPDVIALLPVSEGSLSPRQAFVDPEEPRSPSAAIEAGRRMLQSLPRHWRKKSLKVFSSLGLAGIGRERADLLVEALAARASGDPARAAAALEHATGEGAAPILSYLLGAARLEAGDLKGAATAMAAASASPQKLPGALDDIGRAVQQVLDGDPSGAHSRLVHIIDDTPSLPEAGYLAAELSRKWCDLYDQRRIISDLDGALRSEPCCPGCALDLAQMLAFTDRASTAPGRIRSDATCESGPLDSARDRALALVYAASGAGDEARNAAARAESHDVSALTHGLAPAFLLMGDEAHLEDEFNPEADLVLGPEQSVQHHLYAGLAALWSGRPSRAAEEMERAEEKLMTLDGSEADLSSWVQWVRIMRIRAYLAAGRIPEARAAADAARQAGKGRVNGLLVYSAGLADLAAGDKETAVLLTNRLTAAGLKFWRYLLSAQSALAEGDAGGAESALSLASQGIDIQTTVCPGISVEPYVLSAQARTLLALGRAQAAEHLLMRVIGLGGRGIFAPDILVPAWALVAEARQAQGDKAGAEAAWREILTRWGKGEETPLLQRARAALGVK